MRCIIVIFACILFGGCASNIDFDFRVKSPKSSGGDPSIPSTQK